MLTRRQQLISVKRELDKPLSQQATSKQASAPSREGTASHPRDTNKPIPRKWGVFKVG